MDKWYPGQVLYLEKQEAKEFDWQAMGFLPLEGKNNTITFVKPKNSYEPENDYVDKMVKGPRKFEIGA